MTAILRQILSTIFSMDFKVLALRYDLNTCQIKSAKRKVVICLIFTKFWIALYDKVYITNIIYTRGWLQMYLYKRESNESNQSMHKHSLASRHLMVTPFIVDLLVGGKCLGLMALFLYFDIIEIPK